MIVHHKTGELVAGLMSRQYRGAFNSGAVVATGLTAGFGGWLLWGPLDWVAPAALLGGAYLVNLRARFARIKSSSVKKPTKTTEDEILELQDIYFRMPKQHKPHIEKLLLGAYAQIERGNIDGVQPRLQQARDYKASLSKYIANSDSMEDVEEVRQAAKAMHKALEA